MKTSPVLLFAALSALAAACGRDALPGPVPMTFRAQAENATKTTLNADFSVRWNAADQISVFSAPGQAGTAFKVSSLSDDGLTATFSGLTPESVTGYYYALSPAQDDARLLSTDGTVAAVLPTVQNGTPDTFDPKAALSLAQIKSDAAESADLLHFKNAGALLAVKVPGNYVSAIRITSLDETVAMTGGAQICYNGGTPAVSSTSTSRNYVEITGLAGNIGKTVYAVVYPGEYRLGFEVSFITGTTYNTYKSSNALSLKRNGNIYLIDRDWSVNNDRTGEHAGYTRLITPVISSCTQASPTSATLTFSCSSGKKAGFCLYRRDASEMGDGEQIATLQDPTATSYTFTGLKTGSSYDLGVSAYPDPANTEGITRSEITWFDDLTLEESSSSGLSAAIESTTQNYYNIIINYSLSGLSNKDAEHGLVFSATESTPTCGAVGAEGKLPGPTLKSTADVTIRQCVPNAALDPGTTYYFRAYCYDPDKEIYVYSSAKALRLEAQPEGFAITKEALDTPGTGVSAYSFTAGGSYKGWYAVADCRSGSAVRLRVLNAPSGKVSTKKVEAQATTEGALALVNGQIFGNYNQGIAYQEGAKKYSASIAGADGDYLYCMHGTSYSPLQPVTRAILGVDASGKPDAWWCSCLADGSTYFFDRPIPAGTAGNLVYPQVTAASGPGPKRSWTPYEALSTGPMLLYDGKVAVSEDKIATGVYYTNYDLWETTSGNIYGSSRQRTAIGYNSATGEVFLCVTSSSVTHTQMARIMKGLGCDNAMNLDGGGSSGLYLKGTGMKGNSSRAVASTVGFFAR